MDISHTKRKIKQIAGNDINNFLIDNIPAKKINNIKSTYGSGIEKDEQIICIIDATVFGSAKDGITFTDKAIYWKSRHEDKKGKFKVEDLKSFQIIRNNLTCKKISIDNKHINVSEWDGKLETLLKVFSYFKEKLSDNEGKSSEMKEENDKELKKNKEIMGKEKEYSNNIIFLKCQKCGLDNDFLICPNCEGFEKFVLKNNLAECECGEKIEDIDCTDCGAIIYGKHFFLNKEEEEKVKKEIDEKEGILINGKEKLKEEKFKFSIGKAFLAILLGPIYYVMYLALAKELTRDMALARGQIWIMPIYEKLFTIDDNVICWIIGVFMFFCMSYLSPVGVFFVSLVSIIAIPFIFVFISPVAFNALVFFIIPFLLWVIWAVVDPGDYL